MVRQVVSSFGMRLAIIAIVLAGLTAPVNAESISVPDGPGDVGRFASLVLDAAGYPVVAYHDWTNGDLRVLHCDDADCAGSGESITSPDTVGNVGRHTSLALDSAGNPVVAYHDVGLDVLKVLHCDDPDCAAGGDSITSPASGGEDASLALDPSGNPIVAFEDGGSLRLLRCDDPNCSGGGETVITLDTGGVGDDASLALDATGRPVVAHYDSGSGDLKLYRCDDAACSSGTSTTPDSGGDVGSEPSLVLDEDDDPVIAYLDETNDDVVLIHCDDPNCAGVEPSETLDNFAVSGGFAVDTTLVLDASGLPVVGYTTGAGDLVVVRCTDSACATTETPTRPDPETDAASQLSAALDADGYPVIAYRDTDSSTADLRILHCDDPACVVPVTVTGDDPIEISVDVDSADRPRIAFHDDTDQDLNISFCNDAECSSASQITIDSVGEVGRFASLQLSSSDEPVVAYWDVTNGDLKIARCANSLCVGISGFLSIEAPDTTGVVGAFASMVLDANEYPVVAYHDSSNGDLKVLHCNDAECAGGDESITSPDTGGVVGQFTSITLDASGNPVIAYRDVTNTALKVLHCDDPNCAGAETPTTPDGGGDVGTYPSIALDAAGNPVIAYYDQGNFSLKVLRCDDPACAGTESPVTADNAVSVGSFASLELDSAGNPVISYRDAASEDLLLLRCTTTDCSGTQTPELIDEAGTTGWYTSLRVIDDNPLIAYRDVSNQALRIYRERTGPATCNGLAVTVDIGAGQNPTAGDDVILGTNSAETINGLDGNDTICALGGDDTVFGGDGDDWVDAGPGSDTVLGQADNDTLNGGPGADMLSGNAGNDVMNGDDGGDTAFGGSGNDTMHGGIGNDTIGGSSGTDTIRGEAGSDTISGGSDDDGLISGGDDDDAVNGGGDDDDNVHGDGGNDSVSGNGGKDVVYGDDGDDTVRGGQNDDEVFGGPGDDFVSGNTGTDICDGGVGAEVAGDDAAGNCETIVNVP